jgi:hypothetical protein
MCTELLGPLGATCTLSSGPPVTIPGISCAASFSPSPAPVPPMNESCQDFINQCLSNPCNCIETQLDQRTYAWGPVTLLGGYCTYSCTTEYMVATHTCVACDPPPPECTTTTTTTTTGGPGDCTSAGSN